MVRALVGKNLLFDRIVLGSEVSINGPAEGLDSVDYKRHGGSAGQKQRVCEAEFEVTLRFSLLQRPLLR